MQKYSNNIIYQFHFPKGERPEAMQTSSSPYSIHQHNHHIVQSIAAVCCLLLTSMMACGHFSFTTCHLTQVAQRKRHPERLLRSSSSNHTPIAGAPCRHLASSVSTWKHRIRPHEHLLGVVQRWCPTNAAADDSGWWWRCTQYSPSDLNIYVYIFYTKTPHSASNHHDGSSKERKHSRIATLSRRL